MDVFHYFSGDEEDLDKIEKFNVLKASKPEVTYEIEDPMEFQTEVLE